MPSTRTARRLATGRVAVVYLVVLVAAGFAFRWERTRVETLIASDSCHYVLLAEGLGEGRGYSSGGSEHPDLTRLPLYPLLVAAAARVAGDYELAARIVSTMASALTIVPLFWIGRRLFGPDGAVAAAFLGAFSCVFGYAWCVFPDTLSLLSLALAVATALAAEARRSAALGALAGAFAGLAALTRPELAVAAPLLAAGTLVGARSRRRSRRVLRAAALLAGALLVYSPYAAWASARLGRFVPFPGIEYVRDARSLADRLQLRSIGDPSVDWDEKVRYMLDRDGERFLLESYFLENRLPEISAVDGGGVVPTDGRTSFRRRADELRLRSYIVRRNLLALPSALRSEHLTPVVPWILALAGLALGLSRPSVRRRFPILAAACLATLAPYYSHVETRFGYAVFTGALVWACGGWACAAWLLRGRGRAARLAVHTLIAAGVVLPALFHDPRSGGPTSRRNAQREVAAQARISLRPGGILAVRPLIPYFAGRPYRPLPLATPEEVIRFARRVGAAGIVLEGGIDLQARPEIAPWFEGILPPSLREVVEVDAGAAGTFRVLEVLREGS